MYADNYGQLRLAAVGGVHAGTFDDVTPLTINQNAWIYASRTNVVNDTARSEFGNYTATYAFPFLYLSRELQHCLHKRRFRGVQPLISIVIISKDEASLDGTLSDVAKQAGSLAEPWEIVVVDASSGRLDYIRQRHEATVRWVPFEQPPGVRVSIPHQRNAGVRAARWRHHRVHRRRLRARA